MDTDLPSISPSELTALVGRSDAPLILDVRRPEQFAASEWLLPGALHCPPDHIGAFARNQAPREVVVYCAVSYTHLTLPTILLV